MLNYLRVKSTLNKFQFQFQLLNSNLRLLTYHPIFSTYMTEYGRCAFDVEEEIQLRFMAKLAFPSLLLRWMNDMKEMRVLPWSVIWFPHQHRKHIYQSRENYIWSWCEEMQVIITSSQVSKYKKRKPFPASTPWSPCWYYATPCWYNASHCWYYGTPCWCYATPFGISDHMEFPFRSQKNAYSLRT